LKVDYLIVGQGIAGTLLAHFLRKQGLSILVVDDAYKRSATQVAAGIINPITGRRYVKSWLVDQLIPFAKKTYQEIEEIIGVECFHENRILRSLFNHREESDWLIRTADPLYEDYMLDTVDLGAYAQQTEPAYSYGEVQHAAQVDIGTIAKYYRQILEADHQFRELQFDYEALEIKPEGIQYEDVEANQIVFCEGAKAKQNPFFNYLPFGGAKGEVLIIRIPDIQFEKILKHRVFMVPLSDGTYWIGATYDWKYDHDETTPEGKQFLKDRLDDFLQLPYEIVEHKAAIRPTVKDRRPFLGRHPQLAPLTIFNGLGTKGASLGPFWAAHMTQFLLNNRILDKTVDIRRFEE
jgi:glycine oxidase